MNKKLTFSELTDEIFKNIDISPTHYKTAISHYNAVSECLSDGNAGKDIYVQGSFALGTVIRPFRGGKDADYDLDIVSEGNETKTTISPQQLKQRVKDCILSSPHHKDLLDKDEGRRCWTLKYAPDNNGIGFHMDILPCVPEGADIINIIKLSCSTPEYADLSIAITDKDKAHNRYDWTTGNARGYTNWFSDINEHYLIPVASTQRTALVESRFFESIDEVPTPLLRSPLQRAIQLLKRHRDCKFDSRDNRDDKPISIIITTLVAKIAQQLALYNSPVDELLFAILEELSKYSRLMGDSFQEQAILLPRGYITRTREDGWKIPNPVNPGENFAERWSENNNAKAKAFFDWIKWVKEDLSFEGKDPGEYFTKLQESFGASTIKKTYSTLGLNALSEPSPIILTASSSAPKPYLWK